MPFASCNGVVASDAVLLFRCQVLHHLAKVDDSRAQLVDGGVPILHARLPVRELLWQFIVVCVGVDFLLDLAAHTSARVNSPGAPMSENHLSVMSDRLLSKDKAAESRRLSGPCHTTGTLGCYLRRIPVGHLDLDRTHLTGLEQWPSPKRVTGQEGRLVQVVARLDSRTAAAMVAYRGYLG